MKIELKNIQHAKFASHETECFTATVYIDGVKRGTVENDGQGASHLYHPYQIELEINEYAKTLPQYEAFGELFDHCADTLIDEAFYAVMHAKDLKRLLKKELLFWDEQKQCMVTIECNNESARQAIIATAKTSTLTHPLMVNRVCMNALPFADALELYRKLS